MLKEVIYLQNDWAHNEREILIRVAENDQREFARLMEHYTPAIYSHLLTYLKNALRAEEITQDIFMQIWKHRKELPSISNFPGYIYVITRNRTISALREKMYKWEKSEKDEIEATTLNPEKALEFRQLSETLQQSIEMLPPRRKEVFTMSRFSGMSYDEIAHKLGISKSAVNQHIVEALVFLRTHLRDHQLSILFTCFFIGNLLNR